MHVLVTGGAGFIGSFAAERLLAAGHAVRVLDVLDPQVHPDGVARHLADAAELVRGDVRDRAAVVRALDGAEAVIHCAAAVGVAQSLYRIEHYVDVNVRGTATLLDVLVEQRDRRRTLVVPTSMTGYGEGLYRRPSDGRTLRVDVRSEAAIARFGWEPVDPETGERLEPAPTPEDAALLARNVYALTKRYQEELALSLGATYDLPVVCFRLFNVYGPRQSLTNPYTGVLAIFLSRILASREPVVYEDGDQSRDFISVHDVAEAMLRAVEAGAGATGAVMNLGSGVARRIGDVARSLAELAGVPEIQPNITGRFRRGDVRHCTADVTRARAAFGFEPTMSWEAGLAELVAWSRTTASSDDFTRADRELRDRGLLSARIPTR